MSKYLGTPSLFTQNCVPQSGNCVQWLIIDNVCVVRDNAYVIDEQLTWRPRGTTLLPFLNHRNTSTIRVLWCSVEKRNVLCARNDHNSFRRHYVISPVWLTKPNWNDAVVESNSRIEPILFNIFNIFTSCEKTRKCRSVVTTAVWNHKTTRSA